MAKLRKTELPEHFFKRTLPDDRPVRVRGCDHAGCGQMGEFRAPRVRAIDDSNPLTVAGGTREAYWFCLSHVKEYNAQWNFYEGLGIEDMEKAIRFDAQWNRPSWPLGQAGIPGAGGRKGKKNTGKDQRTPFEEEPLKHVYVHQKAELDALALFELQPPTDFTRIKKHYRLMVKKHHPDLQQTDKARAAAEEKIKAFTAAFALLKGIYERVD